MAPAYTWLHARTHSQVRFVSKADDEHGMHSALLFAHDESEQLVSGAFPPNTLFRLQEIKEAGACQALSKASSTAHILSTPLPFTSAGEWEVDGCLVGQGLDGRPPGGKVKPKQQLIVVTATYRPPIDVPGKLGGMDGSK